MKKINLLLFLALSSLMANSQATNLHENFDNCISSLPTAWQKYSVIGTDSWQCTSAGKTGKGTQMSGYSSGSNHDNEDWLISPLLDFNLYNNPMLSFWCRTKYTGSFLQVFVSNNYTGIGNPNIATWSLLPAVLPTSNSDVWFLSDNISLQSFKNQPCYIAFKYLSNTSAAATWKIDEINVSDGTLMVNKKFLNIGQTSASIPSVASSFQFTMSGGITSFTVNTPAPFEISKDGISYSTQLSYNATISGIAQNVYLRINPTVADKVYRNEITFSLNGNLMAERIMVLGTSLPDDKTLRVYNWNMRWFGDPSLCSCDTNLSRLNATQILKDIDADIYCLQEVVNNNAIATITSSLGPKYQYIVSPYCTSATSTSDPSYTSGQKLAYIYNTQKIENLGTFGLLASTYPSDTSSNSGYYCFASGRFPFIMKTRIKLDNGQSDTLIFSNIHAKAISDITSYNRRQCGAIKMTDSLNALFTGKKIIVLGDYNDYLEGTPVSSLTITPYQYMLDNGFSAITLPSLFTNQTTFVGSNNHIIDNVAVSQNMLSIYRDSSCFIFNEVEKYIPEYGNSTSDHIPVMSYYKFNFPNSTKEVEISAQRSIFNLVNPTHGILTLLLDEVNDTKYLLSVFDLSGTKVYEKQVKANAYTLQFDLSILNDGLYFVELKNATQHEVGKWLNMKN